MYAYAVRVSQSDARRAGKHTFLFAVIAGWHTPMLTAPLPSAHHQKGCCDLLQLHLTRTVADLVRVIEEALLSAQVLKSVDQKAPDRHQSLPCCCPTT